jgi:hypothetical protein
MTILLVYLVFAILTLVVAWLLIRQGRNGNSEVPKDEKEFNVGFWNDSGLDLAERIFDPADYRWLRGELRFPQLASVLARHRKMMAMRWLRGLRRSFNDLVRVPYSAGMAGNPDATPLGWAITFLTLRFHVVLGYALLVVWLFGPYTRMVPSFGWLRAVSRAKSRKDQYGIASVS